MNFSLKVYSNFNPHVVFRSNQAISCYHLTTQTHRFLCYNIVCIPLSRAISSLFTICSVTKHSACCQTFQTSKHCPPCTCGTTQINSSLQRECIRIISAWPTLAVATAKHKNKMLKSLCCMAPLYEKLGQPRLKLAICLYNIRLIIMDAFQKNANKTFTIMMNVNERC